MQYLLQPQTGRSFKAEYPFYVAQWHGRPDHNTINRFRSERLKDEISSIFTQVVLLLESRGHVSLKTVFTDGTKIEANASHYTLYGQVPIERNRKRIEEHLQGLWQYTQEVAAAESKDKTEIKFKAIDKEEVEKTI